MIQRIFLLIFLFIPILDSSALDITEESKKETLKKIQSYDKFEGEWKGRYKIIYVSTNLPDKTEYIDVRINIKGNKILFDIRPKDGGWSGVSRNMQFYYNELLLKIHAVNQGGVWLETFDIVIARESNDKAKLYLMRTINNWAGAVNGVDNIYSVIGEGEIERVK